MIEKLSKKIVNYQSEVGIIQKKDINVYQYGYTLMAEVIFNISIFMFIGISLNKLKEVVFFVCMFMPLRSFAGGYHAKKTWQCVIISNLCIVMTIGLSELNIYNIFFKYIYLIGVFVLGVIIICISPIESKNKKLTLIENGLYKKCTAGVFLIELIICIELFVFDKYMLLGILFFVYLIQIISLFVSHCIEKRIHIDIL